MKKKTETKYRVKSVKLQPQFRRLPTKLWHFIAPGKLRFHVVKIKPAKKSRRNKRQIWKEIIPKQNYLWKVTAMWNSNDHTKKIRPKIPRSLSIPRGCDAVWRKGLKSTIDAHYIHIIIMKKEWLKLSAGWQRSIKCDMDFLPMKNRKPVCEKTNEKAE